MKKEKINLSKILLKNKHVNNYTKLLIYLSRLNYYEDYYIPNKKIMNMLGINKNRVIVLLKQLESDRIIAIFYKGRKRYFTFIALNQSEEEIIDKTNQVFDYDWLSDEGGF